MQLDSDDVKHPSTDSISARRCTKTPPSQVQFYYYSFTFLPMECWSKVLRRDGSTLGLLRLLVLIYCTEDSGPYDRSAFHSWYSQLSIQFSGKKIRPRIHNKIAVAFWINNNITSLSTLIAQELHTVCARHAYYRWSYVHFDWAWNNTE